jgi:hypothetical protein
MPVRSSLAEAHRIAVQAEAHRIAVQAIGIKFNLGS